MSIELLNPGEIERLRRAGQAAAQTLAWVGAQLRVGMTTQEIDGLVREDTRRRGGKPSQLGYHGFPGALCTSRNNVVCHGIPSAKEKVLEGDIINLDITTELDGFHGDTSRTFMMGKVAPRTQALVELAEQCMLVGIEEIHEGARLGDIGGAISELAARAGATVVRDFGGHGIGRQMHLDPHIPHVGKRGSGMRLRAGMAFTVEPMINLGSSEVRILEDGWTVVTADSSLSAQFEHTLVVTQEGCEVLTRL